MKWRLPSLLFERGMYLSFGESLGVIRDWPWGERRDFGYEIVEPSELRQGERVGHESADQKQD